MGGWVFGYVSSEFFPKGFCPYTSELSLQPEFRPILFPIFCHFYLDLIQQGFKEAGQVPLSAASMVVSLTTPFSFEILLRVFCISGTRA